MSHEVYSYNNFYNGGYRSHGHCGGHYNPCFIPYGNPFYAMSSIYTTMAIFGTAMNMMTRNSPSFSGHTPNYYNNPYNRPNYNYNSYSHQMPLMPPQNNFNLNGMGNNFSMYSGSALTAKTSAQYGNNFSRSNFNDMPANIKPFNYESPSSNAYQLINNAGGSKASRTGGTSTYPVVKPTYSTIKGNQLNAEFLAKAKSVAANINCDVEDLLAVMNSESGIDSQKWNKSRSAVGLIQFTDIALADLKRVYGLSYTKEDIAKMPALEQLDLAEKFYKLNTDKFGGRKLTAGDLYAITYVPAFAANEVLTRRGDKYYKGNEGLDTNEDGIITKTDLNLHLARKRVNLSTFA